jgi:hypothetical protein
MSQGPDVIRHVGMAVHVVVDEPTENGMNESLGIACGDGDARFVVGVRGCRGRTGSGGVRLPKAGSNWRTALGHHCSSRCRKVVPGQCSSRAWRGILPRTGFCMLPSGNSGQSIPEPWTFHRRLRESRGVRPGTCRPVPVLRPEEINCLGAGSRFLEAVEAATHHELDEVALAAALQATVAPVAERIVEEQRGSSGAWNGQQAIRLRPQRLSGIPNWRGCVLAFISPACSWSRSIKNLVPSLEKQGCPMNNLIIISFEGIVVNYL